MKTKCFGIFFLTLCFGLCSCVSTLDTNRLSRVEEGMSQDDVQFLLGQPFSKKSYNNKEEWSYRKYVGRTQAPEDIKVVVTFDDNGKVAACDSEKVTTKGILIER